MKFLPWRRKNGSSVKESLSSQAEAELYSLQRAWYPRSVDRQHGGFLCDFGDRWQPSGPQNKMLEFQARQTLAAARGAARSSHAAVLREAALHGFRYLKETMWDHSRGGWFRMLDQVGNPLESATKHGHGSSYAISACAACYELTGDRECLALAKSAFAWLEEHAHDGRHGGYFVFYRQDGALILTSEGLPPGVLADPIGTPIGFKDANTTSDLLKAFADLFRLWPDPLLRTRLEEMLCIVRDRLVVAPGVMHMNAHANWAPLPDIVSYGHVLRAANLLLAGSTALSGAVDSTTAGVVKSMVDTMLNVAWDPERGGFHAAGGSFAPRDIEGAKVFVRKKGWWCQAEGLRALLAMARLYPEDPADYQAHVVRLWDYIIKYLIDPRHGGWFQAGIDENPEARKLPKGFTWKDCSHETEALLEYLQVLDPRGS
jgi:mannose/cellobiose epimerase-like protein (N-acyl-D-glucosamine 2-epimerase family)